MLRRSVLLLPFIFLSNNSVAAITPEQKLEDEVWESAKRLAYISVKTAHCVLLEDTENARRGLRYLEKERKEAFRLAKKIKDREVKLAYQKVIEVTYLYANDPYDEDSSKAYTQSLVRLSTLLGKSMDE